MNVADNMEVRPLESTRKSTRIAEVLDRNLAVPFPSEIEEVVHLTENWSCWFGEVESVRIFNTAKVVLRNGINNNVAL